MENENKQDDFNPEAKEEEKPKKESYQPKLVKVFSEADL